MTREVRGKKKERRKPNPRTQTHTKGKAKITDIFSFRQKETNVYK